MLTFCLFFLARRFSVAFGIVLSPVSRRLSCFSAQAAFSLMACQSFLIFLDVRRDTTDVLPLLVRMLFSYFMNMNLTKKGFYQIILICSLLSRQHTLTLS